jgi:hypothetical protein
MSSNGPYYVIGTGRRFAVVDAATGAVVETYAFRIDAVRAAAALSG